MNHIANRQCFLLWSHNASSEQVQDLKINWKIDKIFELPAELRSIWSQVPVRDINWNIYVSKICEWVKGHSQKNDLVVVQGEYGLTYYMVDWCKANNLLPVYSLTERNSVEEKKITGEIIKVSKFVHCGFRPFYSFPSKNGSSE